jgi:hypothetical protein
VRITESEVIPMPTPAQIKALRSRALDAGIPWDDLPLLLRVERITRPAHRGSGEAEGLLPIGRSTWHKWVAEGLVPPPVRFENGVSAWHRYDVITIALDGLAGRPPGHGRKLPPRAKPKKPTKEELLKPARDAAAGE